MMDRHSSLFSRRDWLKAVGAGGLSAAVASVGIAAAAGAEKRGLTYQQVLAAAPWPVRYGLGVAVFQDRLWVLGGTASARTGTQFNDVWSSADGRQWRRELASAPWAPRWGHAVFALSDRLWVIGGLASVSPIVNLNDIWSSPDGKQWTRVLADAPWRGRHVWATTVHGNRMFLIGGATDGSGSYQDVLSSADGIHWRSETIQKPWFVGRKYHAAASYRGRIVLAAGVTNDASQLGGGQYLGDVWSSEDGRAWTCIAPRAPWLPRCAHALVAYQDRLWLVGGELAVRRYTTDLWSSVDGENWEQETSEFAWPSRIGGKVVVFNKQVWIVGGTYRPDYRQSTGRVKSQEGLSRDYVSMNDIWTFEARAATGPSR